jgi:hypothetical protein
VFLRDNRTRRDVMRIKEIRFVSAWRSTVALFDAAL